jgi:hypothetical protein
MSWPPGGLGPFQLGDPDRGRFGGGQRRLQPDRLQRLGVGRDRRRLGPVGFRQLGGRSLGRPGKSRSSLPILPRVLELLGVFGAKRPSISRQAPLGAWHH